MKRLFSWVMAAGLALASVAAVAAEPAIGGYCPVAYVKMGKAVKGDPKWSAERDGQTFLFSAPEAKAMFEKDAKAFGVAYHGWCATGVAMGKKIASNPEIFSVKDGVTYLFSSAEAKAMFDKDPAMTVSKADGAWKSLR
jgi:YHS domain-containing protein